MTTVIATVITVKIIWYVNDDTPYESNPYKNDSFTIQSGIKNNYSNDYYDDSIKSNESPKWNILPENSVVEADSNYDYHGILKRVMTHLDQYGPDDWFYDGTIDCKDWACSFLDLWYDTYNGVDGSCILVRNVNQEMRMDHLFVAVWSSEDKWIFIEPQACHITDWSLESFWGYKYNEECNCYNETRKFFEQCDRLADDREKCNHLIEVTKVDNTYNQIWWDDTHPIQYHTDKW
ncbi:MAG: hypothetical protein IK002_00235 [Treponema sp.]|uniref:hypothetical protein n=1 Tax=Treponema sp. TaxID=166 RepID=UPI00298DD143|nr:hypothetical protein [Treponema sp.]MBR5932391.1 hypothetical protein [Treponema sp.]